MYRRGITERVLAGLADSPAVFLQGPRQCGKSTLVQMLAESRHPARYLSLDDPSQLEAATSDPNGFVAALSGDIVIDEVQAAPALFAAIKRAVDQDRRPGRFLLTGSANALVFPELARALTGRVDLVTLLGLSQGELLGVREGFVDWAFSGKSLPRDLRVGMFRPAQVLVGGYPEVVGRKTPERRAAWFEAYVTTLLQRDVRNLAEVDALAELPRILRLCASRVGGLLNFAELARSLAVPQTTLKRYFALLEAVFLVHRLPAWHANLGKRLVKSPKLYFHDSGLACHLQGIDAGAWDEASTRRGALLENFVFGELERQLGWSRTQAKLHHYRSHAGEEVDFILEDARGRLVGVEVKATATPSSADAAGLRALAAVLGDRFVRGIVLTTGTEVVSWNERVHALPISALWSLEAATSPDS